jgi:DNA-binding transcriptional regulator YiaG
VGLFENGARAPHPVSIVAIRTALETAGLRFIAENGGGPGLRRRESKGNPVALPLTSEQCRAARAMLNLSRGDLAKAASVAVYLVARFELDQFEPLSRALAAIRAALEKAGVEFIEENGGGPGVRLSKQPGGL